MDGHGDAEGNYTLVRYSEPGGRPGLYPIGTFHLNQTASGALPLLRLQTRISWPAGRPPADQEPSSPTDPGRGRVAPPQCGRPARVRCL